MYVYVQASNSWGRPKFDPRDIIGTTCKESNKKFYATKIKTPGTMIPEREIFKLIHLSVYVKSDSSGGTKNNPRVN